jgi:NAD(P)-binding Rossmann-like domain
MVQFSLVYNLLYVTTIVTVVSSAFVPQKIATSNNIRIRSLNNIQFQSTSISNDRRYDNILYSSVTSDNDTTEYELLSLPARPGRQLKVIIGGGGVGGLTTALCLLKRGIDVTVYEKTAAFARFGGPIQFASNALSVLKAIDDTLFERIMSKFTFTGTRVCGIKDGLRADGSFRMTNDSLDYIINPSAPADWFVKFPLKVNTNFYVVLRCGSCATFRPQNVSCMLLIVFKNCFFRSLRNVLIYLACPTRAS